MRFIVAFSLVFWALSAHADVKLTQVTGYSQQQGLNINDNANVILFGGFAGAATNVAGAACSTGDVTATCNNCGATLDSQCNETRAYPELELRLTFLSTEAIGVPRLSIRRTGTGTGASILVNNVIPSIATTTQTNQTVTLTARWADICAAMDEDGNSTSCDLENKIDTFQVGIDAGGGTTLEDSGDDSMSFQITVRKPGTAFNTTTPASCSGFCNYSFFPGDGKAYIENPKFGTIPNGGQVRKVHFVCVEGTDFNQIIGTDIIATVDVLNGALVNNFIEGLTNGNAYSCFTTTEDDAGNRGLWMRDTDIANCPAGYVAPSGLTTCRQVRPDAVGGLFKDNCFIATAAFGSKFEPHVKTLRAFRDKYLKTNVVGRVFVETYYALSPVIADWIAASETRRAITRFALMPVVATVRLFMAAPLMFLLGIFSLYGLGLFTAVHRHRQPVRYKGKR